MLTTYSIVGYDKKTKEFGVAVHSKFLGVGGVVPWSSSYGAIASQSLTNSNIGTKGLEMLKKGYSANEVREYFIEKDEKIELRQFGIIDTKGNITSFTGKNCLNYANSLEGDSCVAQGNVLLGNIVLKEMVKGFEEAQGDLSSKLVNALIRGQEAGGEKRGKQAAALIVHQSGKEFLGETDKKVDLRIDDSLTPLVDLKALLETHRVECSKNHRESYFKFSGNVKSRLLDFLLELDFIGSHLEDDETLEERIIKIARDTNFKEDVFKEDVF